MSPKWSVRDDLGELDSEKWVPLGFTAMGLVPGGRAGFVEGEAEGLGFWAPSIWEARRVCEPSPKAERKLLEAENLKKSEGKRAEAEDEKGLAPAGKPGTMLIW